MNNTIPPTLSQFFQSLFKRKDGALPIVLYIFPVLFWMLFFLSNGLKSSSLAPFTKGTKTVVQGSKMVNQLQSDLVYISSKAEKSTILDLTKQQISNSVPNENFLSRKAKKQLEKVAAQTSRSPYNGKNISLSDSLTIRIHKDTVAKEELNYDINHFKHTHNNQQQNSSNKANQKATSRADSLKILLENSGQYTGNQLNYLGGNPYKSSKENINKNSNQNAYEDDYMFAYEAGLEDYQARQNENSFYKNKTQDKKDNREHNQSSKTVSTAAVKEKKLAFSTHVGAKDNFKTPSSKTVNPSVQSVNYPSNNYNNSSSDINSTSGDGFNRNSETLESSPPPLDLSKSINAVIDQKVKIRSGDKIQIRVMEDTHWKNIWIPRHTILYGLVSITGRRAKIQIPSIQLRNAYGEVEIIRTNLVAYDSDGIEGVYIDGTFNQHTRSAINEAINTGANVGLNSSLGRYSLRLGRKANNNPKVFIPTGYIIKLYDRSGISNAQTFKNRQGINY